MASTIRIECGEARWDVPAGPSAIRRVREAAPGLAASLAAAARMPAGDALPVLREAMGALCGDAAAHVWDAAMGQLDGAPDERRAEAMAQILVHVLHAWEEEAGSLVARLEDRYLTEARCAPPHQHEVMGQLCMLNDSLGCFLAVCALLRDPMVPDGARAALLCRMVFADPEDPESFGDSAGGALDAALWDLFGIDLPGDRWFDGERAISWDEDHDRIVATARMAYGLGWDEMRALPYSEANLLVGMAPHDTPMGQALYYRLAEEPKRTKYNGEQVDAFRKLRNHYRLKG